MYIFNGEAFLGKIHVYPTFLEVLANSIQQEKMKSIRIGGDETKC